MEILSPAGNFEQALAGIDGGCNALYGGLKSWNARNRAQNFTLEEYPKVVKYCREKDVKFYLTLNIAFRDEEIDDILKTFSSKEFIIPDAVILSDMGLIKALKKNFPHLIIHVSTQFGAHCIDDVKYLESIGVSRVILAREVLLNDIEMIVNNTSLEVEVFIYGSQCIGFSGKCYLGGMVLGGSGNRGRCIGLCRDVYEYKNDIGQFFYSKDLDAISNIKKLDEIGVSSIKIEGRMRKPTEIFEVVSNLRSILDLSKSKMKEEYSGYLSNILPVQGLIEKVNSRSEKLILETSTITKKVILNKKNIAFKLFINESSILEKIDFINEFGERYIGCFDNTSKEMETKEFDEIYNYFIKEFELCNIYEFKLNKSEKQNLKYNKIALQKFFDEIKFGEIHHEKHSFRKNNQNNKLVLEVDDGNIINSLNYNGLQGIIYNIHGYDDFLEVIAKNKNNTRLIYKLPLFDWDSKGISSYLDHLYGKNIMITRWSQIKYLTQYKFNSVSADYTLNCWNEQSIDILKKNGVDRVTGSPELSNAENIKLASDASMDLELILLGKMPLMYSRHCFAESLNCNSKCNELKYLANTDKGFGFEMHCMKNHREIVFETPFYSDIYTLSASKNTLFRYIARFDSLNKIRENLEMILDDEKFYETLVKQRIWKGHLPGDFMESVR